MINKVAVRMSIERVFGHSTAKHLIAGPDL